MASIEVSPNGTALISLQAMLDKVKGYASSKDVDLYKPISIAEGGVGAPYDVSECTEATCAYIPIRSVVPISFTIRSIVRAI